MKSLENCLNSLAEQSVTAFQVKLIDYGSIAEYREGVERLVKSYEFVKLIHCHTEQQLWCKSRAINIALKSCQTEYLFVGDIDMIYHSDFVKTLQEKASPDRTTYFQVGFLSEEETKTQKAFEEREIAFASQKEATGMTLYNTALLKSIHGFDEFYNGWGSEDTDVHIRLKNAGNELDFYTDSILMLHQWHPKDYRSKNDRTPFHSSLEQINAYYLNTVVETKKIKANTNSEWGIYYQADYEALDHIDAHFSITNKLGELTAFINGVLLLNADQVIKLTIQRDKNYKSLKQTLKKGIGQKVISYNTMSDINDSLLESLVSHFRTKAYRYKYNTSTQVITLIINL